MIRHLFISPQSCMAWRKGLIRWSSQISRASKFHTHSNNWNSAKNRAIKFHNQYACASIHLGHGPQRYNVTPVTYTGRKHMSTAKGNSNSDNLETKTYVELYFLQKIRFLRVMGRFAKLSVVLFLAGSPVSLIGAQLGIVSVGTATDISAVFAAYAVLFTLQSYVFSSRVVGKIMISLDEETVKFSHLSLFGDRRDVVFKPRDIVPNKAIGSYICPVQIKSYSKRLLFLPGQGNIESDLERIDMLLSGKFSGGDGKR